MQDEVVVSIVCITYNQEKCIRSALEGFVAQKTDFKIEALIHDDASTDGTADIIREYERKYPNLIKGTFQTENQYSKGIWPYGIAASKAKGIYIALCDGDDYWIDPLKLQKQYEALEKRPDVDACAHSCIKTRNERVVDANKRSEETCVLPVPYFIAGGAVPTSSLMIRRDRFFRSVKFAGCLDYFMRIQFSIPNGILYLDEAAFASVYRTGAQGSWTSQMKSDREKTYAHRENLMRNLSLLNAETNFVYDVEIKKKLRSCECEQLITLGDYKRAVREYADELKDLPKGIRQNVKTAVFSPGLARVFIFVKGLIKQGFLPFLRWRRFRKYQTLVKNMN